MSDADKPSSDSPDRASSVLVTGAEIARLSGVTRAAVSNWRRRYEDFPPAVGGSASNPLFAWKAVQEWLGRRDKSQEVSLEVQTWQALCTTYGDAIGAHVASAAEYLVGEAPSSPKAVAYTSGAPQGVPMEAPIRALLDRFRESAGPAEAVEALVSRMMTGTARRSGTDLGASSHVIRAISHLAPELRPGQTVLDPACGMGTLLLNLYPQLELTRLGQEADNDYARLARARCAAAGRQGAHIAAGDSLRADCYPDTAVDLVICVPPANTDWGREELLIDPRWKFGTPPRSEGELAWLQHAYAHTAPGGHVLMVMPASVAYRKAGRRIRAELLRRGVLRTVVALPGGVAAPAHRLPVHLWLLRRPESTVGRPSTVTMVDLTANNPEGSLTPDQGQTDIPLVDLLDDVVDLTPAAHIPVVRRDLAVEYERARTELNAALVSLGTLLPDLRAGDGAGLWEGATVTVADLARAGLIELHGGAARPIGDQIDPDYLDGCLAAGPNIRRSTSQSGAYRPAAKSARIPQRDLSVQRRYGTAFRSLREAEARAEEFAAAVRRIAEVAREGLGSGSLEPEERRR